jgi:hypothetical protein
LSFYSRAAHVCILFFRFADDIEDMTGKRPWIGWMICWKYISPLALFIVVIATIYDLCKSSAAYDVFVGCEQVNYMKVLGEHSGLLSRQQMGDENLAKSTALFSLS